MKIIDEFIRKFKIGPKVSDMKPIIGKLGNANIMMEIENMRNLKSNLFCLIIIYYSLLVY